VVRAGAQAASCDDGLQLPHADALQACVDLANAHGGGTVLVGSGIYSTGTWPITLRSNVTLLGQGHLGAKLAPFGSGPIIGTVGDNTAIVALTFDQTNALEGAIRFAPLAADHSNVRIENNLFTAMLTSGSLPASGIYSVVGSNSFQRIAIRGNVFQYSGGTNSSFSAVYLGATNGNGAMADIRVENNDISVVGSLIGPTPISIFSSPTSLQPARGVVVSGNSLRNNGGFGVALQGVFDAQVTGNSLEATASALSLQPAGGLACGAMVTGNRFRSSKATIASVCAGNSVLTHNTDDGALAGMGRTSVAIRAYRNGNQTFTAGTDTVLLYNAEDTDYGGNFDTSTGSFTAPFSGLYEIRACARFSATNFAPGDTAHITLDSGGDGLALQRVVSGGTSSFQGCVADLVVLTSGAVVRAVVDASGAATTRTVSGTGRYSSFFSVERVSD
jgi:hypothetical protein